ncbi:MAG TPA: DUF1501 domain-containing protein [Gemmataceae bacterium]|nr:DUF1501 domain-containing protein [Gemmataceae bacterium]
MFKYTRRRFLQASLAAAPLMALTPTVPLFVARVARAGAKAIPGRILVVVELVGGNDGINTVVPYADEGYAKYRRSLRLPRDQLVRLDDQIGLHPALKPLAAVWEAGHLAIVQGVSYPNPSRSHFVSRGVWHTARRDFGREPGIGWLGRGLDEAIDRLAPAVFVGDAVVPVALRGRRRSCVSLGRPEDCRLLAEVPSGGPAALVPSVGPQGDDLLAYAQRAAVDAAGAADLFARTGLAAGGPRYPATPLGRRFQVVARAIKAGLSASTYYLTQGDGDVGAGSYDTHAGQLSVHAGLLAELAEGWVSLLSDLRTSRLEERVALMAFSEFGRRVEENASGGTDHGTAGPVLLAGGSIRGGLIGPTPRLIDLEGGDLKGAVDFRQVYATVLEHWLGVPAKVALGGSFDALPLFRVVP